MFPGESEDVKEKAREKVKEPDMYRVLLHNDDYTIMEFVVEVLMKVFRKTVMDATKIMLHVHKNGKGNVGSFTYDVAITKVNQAHKMARERQYPLKCTIEKE